MTTPGRSWTHLAAAVFYEWLYERHDELLPARHDICLFMGPPKIDAYRLGLAISWLEKQGMIECWRGARGKRDRHLMIRVKTTGRIYRTAGCPLPLPENV